MENLVVCHPVCCRREGVYLVDGDAFLNLLKRLRLLRELILEIRKLKTGLFVFGRFYLWIPMKNNNQIEPTKKKQNVKHLSQLLH